MEKFQCEECGCYRYIDREGSGKDEFGEFEDCVCEDCGHITRIYYKED